MQRRASPPRAVEQRRRALQVASLRVLGGAEPSPRGLAGLGLSAAATALAPDVLAQAGSGLPNPLHVLNAAEEAEELLRKTKSGGREFWAGSGDLGAGGGGGAAKKPKLSHAAAASSAGALPKLERSQLLALPPAGREAGAGGAVGGSAAGAFGGAEGAAGGGGAGPSGASALLALSDPLATSAATSPVATTSASPLGSSGPVLPPLPLSNLNRNIADISWLTHSSLTPREQEFTDFLSGMLSNRGPLPSPGRVSTIDILRLRSHSQVGEIELIRAQESVQHQGQGMQVRRSSTLCRRVAVRLLG